MPKVRIEKRQLAKLREQWQNASRENIAKRPKMMTNLRKDCQVKFDELGQRIFNRFLERVEVVEDAPAYENIEYEPEDAQLLARVEDLHRQLGALAEKVAKNRKEIPEQVRQVLKKQFQETQPRLDPMPDERSAQIVDPNTDLAATVNALDRGFQTLDQSLVNVKKSLPAVVERATRVSKVIEEERKRKRT